MQVPASRRIIFYPANPWQHKNHARLWQLCALCRISTASAMAGAFRQAARRKRPRFPVAGHRSGSGGPVIDLGFVPMDDMPASYTAARSSWSFLRFLRGLRHPVGRSDGLRLSDCCANCTSRSRMCGRCRPVGRCPRSPRRLPRQSPVYGTIQSYGSRWRNGAACAHRATAGPALVPKLIDAYAAGTPARRGSLEVNYG